MTVLGRTLSIFHKAARTVPLQPLFPDARLLEPYTGLEHCTRLEHTGIRTLRGREQCGRDVYYCLSSV